MDWLKAFRNYRRVYRVHALQKMFQRNIELNDIDNILKNIKIIEEYHDDKPFPSCLCLGYTKRKRPLHIVFSVNDNDKTVFIITVYEPDPGKWDQKFERRKL